MSFLKVGDTQKSICYNCKSFVDITFKLKDTSLSDGGEVIKNILTIGIPSL